MGLILRSSDRPGRRNRPTDEVAEAIVHEMNRQGIADMVADHGFDVMELARVVVRAADGDVIPFRRPP
ncbi:hypothetical protein BraRD5C2_38090 [Bradyrhizobium sp. RD5-C2]|nr:hypothetical protein BraRD5C2_38090 [Bradyrhizobium sp. RD5-C2]